MTARGLRFSSIETMPTGMAELVRERERVQNERLARALNNIEKGQSPPKKNKYGAVPTVVNGIRFDSKREARYFEKLVERKAAGEVAYFLRQVPLHLPGGTRLVVDFQIHYPDGRVEYVDVKGRETDSFKIKRREIEAIYPIRILLA